MKEKTFTDTVLDARKDDVKKKMESEKPKDCFECVYFDTYGKHICEKDLLWFNCRGKEGEKRG